jgi:hypothetical protein
MFALHGTGLDEVPARAKAARASNADLSYDNSIAVLVPAPHGDVVQRASPLLGGQSEQVTGPRDGFVGKMQTAIAEAGTRHGIVPSLERRAGERCDKHTRRRDREDLALL